MTITSDTIKNNVRDCATLPWSRLRQMERNSLKEAKGRDVEKLKHAILTLGFNFPFFIWAGNEYILDGAGRVLALSALESDGIEIPDLPVVEINADTLEEAKALVLQVSSEHGLISQSSFQAFAEGLDIEALSHSISLPDIDFGKLVNFQAFEKDPDEVPEVPDSPVTQLGDLYEIGGHRLLCGDSTLAETYKTLLGERQAEMVFTDPPYGMSYGGGRARDAKNGNAKAHGEIMGDDLRDEALGKFLHSVFTSAGHFVKNGSAWYVCFPWRTYKQFEDALRSAGMEPDNCITWNKASVGLGYKHYRPQHEFIFYIKGDTWNGGQSESDVWEISRGNTGAYVHPTQKPVALIERAINNSSSPADLILECFGGSGSTLVASQTTGRTCFASELDPHYCDVIIARMRSLFPDLPITRNGEAF